MTLRPTLRGKLLLTLPVIAAGIYLNAQLPTEAEGLNLPNDSTVSHTYEGDAVITPSEYTPDYHLDVYEDGSGVLYDGDYEIRTFDGDFFPWDCTENGNATCGPTAPASVRGPKCKDFALDYALFTYCTNAPLRWHAI